MCGIMGYIGVKPAWPIIMTGLKRLEYRGYDSAGIATLSGDDNAVIHLARAVGPLHRLEQAFPQGLDGSVGIGHTRWATHGQVNVANAHPQLDQHKRLAMVHNGIIDNAHELELMLGPLERHSETDSELLINLIALHLRELGPLTAKQATFGLTSAVRNALGLIKGTAAIVVLDQHAQELVAARQGSPVVIGLSDEATYVASDAQALAPFTDRVIHLEDGDIARLTPGHLEIINLDQHDRERRIELLEQPQEHAQGATHPHLYLSELLEQPEALDRAMRGRLDPSMRTARLDELEGFEATLQSVARVALYGCGTSLLAGAIGRQFLERHARIPSVAEDAAELAGLNPVHDPRALYVGLSQSGETADALTLLRELKLRGAHTMTITNVVGNSMARLAQANLYTHAGAEHSVASTKSFSAQVLTLMLFTLKMARQRGLSPQEGAKWLDAMQALPEAAHAMLAQREQLQALAHQHAQARYTMFVGRGASYAVACEGALKLKELSYIPSEGLSGAQMKHGPIALIEPGTPVWAIAPPDHTRERMLGNLHELKARGAYLMVIASGDDHQVAALADALIALPPHHEINAPILSALPLQLYAYEVALTLGRSIDRPRNLAKAVTVE